MKAVHREAWRSSAEAVALLHIEKQGQATAP